MMYPRVFNLKEKQKTKKNFSNEKLPPHCDNEYVQHCLRGVATFIAIFHARKVTGDLCSYPFQKLNLAVGGVYIEQHR
jgi:hypothetical protein